MRINPFLHSQVFNPKQLEAMSAAFTAVCNVIGLADHKDMMTELVASRIIERAGCGMHSKAALYLSVMKEFKADA
jgi:hypothetical protein